MRIERRRRRGRSRRKGEEEEETSHREGQRERNIIYPPPMAKVSCTPSPHPLSPQRFLHLTSSHIPTSGLDAQSLLAACWMLEMP